MADAKDAPGWRPDPYFDGRDRFWDGRRWTDHTCPAGTGGDVPGHAPLGALGRLPALDGPPSMSAPTPTRTAEGSKRMLSNRKRRRLSKREQLRWEHPSLYQLRYGPRGVVINSFNLLFFGFLSWLQFERGRWPGALIFIVFALLAIWGLVRNLRLRGVESE